MSLEIDLRRFAAWMQTRNSPKLTPLETARFVLDAGWSGEDAVTAVAVAGAESGYKPRALNVDKHHGKEDFGLFQISEIHRPTETQKYDPAENAKVGYAIWKRRADRGEDGFRAWMAYAAGKHEEFMPAAREAVGQAMIERA